jgi:hypothetical protein
VYGVAKNPGIDVKAGLTVVAIKRDQLCGLSVAGVGYAALRIDSTT